jgi:hypothetical protein
MYKLLETMLTITKSYVVGRKLYRDYAKNVERCYVLVTRKFKQKGWKNHPSDFGDLMSIRHSFYKNIPEYAGGILIQYLVIRGKSMKSGKYKKKLFLYYSKKAHPHYHATPSLHWRNKNKEVGNDT